jgi:hypothetical protein
VLQFRTDSRYARPTVTATATAVRPEMKTGIFVRSDELRRMSGPSVRGSGAGASEHVTAI